jgi:hypothetical protein
LIQQSFESWEDGKPPRLEDYRAVGDEILTGLTFKGYLGRRMIVDFPSDLPDLRRRFERL